jgi:hypothetical protein
VAIAVNKSCKSQLTNIVTGASLGKALAGRLLTGDLTWITPEGATKTLELTTFHVPHAADERTSMLAALEAHLNARDTTTNAERKGTVRIVAGDGNCLWHEDELSYTNRLPTPADKARHAATDFKDHMERVTELQNQKPHGSFNPSAAFTHSQGKCQTRLDYVFSNIDMVKHVRHTDPLDGIFVRLKNMEVNSAHYWIESTPPLSLLRITRPYTTAVFRAEPRHDINLANKDELKKLKNAATPVLQSFWASLAADLKEAFIEGEALTAESSDADWTQCEAALGQAIEAVRHPHCSGRP